LPAGEVVFHRDDPSDFLYLLRSGSVVILLTTVDGRELVVNESCPGECIDELAVAGCQPHTMDAVTRKPSELVMIPRADLLAVLGQEPLLVRSMLESAARWLRASSDRESALAFLDAPARLALMLLKLDHEASSVGYLTASQEELAQFIGVTRQTAARILGEWRRAGWIFTGRGRVALLNRQALRRLIEEPQ
jgi:CRP-like cAMP-binding protein